MKDLINIIYNTFMMPFEKLLLHNIRQELITQVKGKTLEIGSGGGINFNYYNPQNIESLKVIDLKFNKAIKNHSLNEKMEIEYQSCNAEKLPFKDNTFDSIVVTLSLCSIDNQDKALDEIHRVLKPEGKFYFIEHVLPPDEKWHNTANRLNKYWKPIGKCNINRATHENIKKHGFEFEDFEIVGKECFIFVKGIAKLVL